MNKNYVLIDDKVIVLDEYGENKVEEYTDNFEEILMQENVIEYIQKRIKYIDEIRDKQIKYKKFVPKLTLITLLIVTIISVMGITSNTIPIIGCLCIYAVVFLSAGSRDLNTYRNYKSEMITDELVNIEYEELNKDLVKEKEKLEELKSDKSKDKEVNTLIIGKVNNIEVLKDIRNKLELYNIIGNNIDKYYKLYQVDKLIDNLNKKGYSSEECKVALKFVKENGPRLIKK